MANEDDDLAWCETIWFFFLNMVVVVSDENTIYGSSWIIVVKSSKLLPGS